MLIKLPITAPELVDLSGEQFLRVDPSSVTALAEQAFADVSHLLRTSHLEQLLLTCPPEVPSP
jgi:fumarate hydratase class I